MATKIYINTDLKDLTANAVANKNRPTQVVRLPQIVEGETLDVELSLVNSNGGYDSRSGDSNVALAVAVSEKGAVATSGTFTLTAGTETTAAIPYNASAEALQTALNDLNSKTGPYGSTVTVTKLSPGSYRVIFDAVGARTIFGGTSIDLAPESEVVAATAVVGSATIRAQMIIEISQQPAIYTSTWTTHANKFNGELDANTARVQELIATGQDAFFEVKVDNDVVCQVPIAVLPAVAAPNSLPAHVLPSNINEFANDPSTNGNFNAANWLTDLGSPENYAVWANITGTLSDQTDLQAALDAKGSASQQTTNTANIATNTANIATNTASIATNTANIATNTANIATNTTAIAAIPFKKVDVAGSEVAYIGGDQTGNARGEDALDIQSKRTAVTQIASAVRAIAVGIKNTVAATNSTVFGEENTVNSSAIDSSVVGRENVISGERTIAHGSILTTGSGDNNNVLIGRTIDATGDNSIGIGDDIDIAGSQSVALGYQCQINGNNAASVGRNVVAPANVGEFGIWDYSGGTKSRGGSVRVSNLGNADNPDDGFVSLSVNDSDRSPLDGGSTDGAEAATTLPREMATIRRNGDEVLIDLNIAGTVKSVSMGDATRSCAGNQASCRKPLGAAIQNVEADSVTIKTMRQMTQAAYDLITPDANTVYIIVG